MGNEVVLIDSFALAGYKSFGPEIQRFENLSKINIFIGQNNCGKSNLLTFINNVYPKLSQKEGLAFEPLERHVLSGAEFKVGLSIQDKDIVDRPLSDYLNSLYQKKAEIDQTEKVWFDFDSSYNVVGSSWQESFVILNDQAIQSLWKKLTNQTGGSRSQHWLPESMRRLTPSFKPLNSVLIPAIRQIGKKGSTSNDFSGNGIIERLVRLQNPDVHNQIDRNKFDKINEFLCNVTDNPTSRIEIPHERDTILAHIDGKTLPLESLGTGIHEVIILASAATILENTAICMEEPELHLNPILQKKLVRYLCENTSNQYFITSHSSSFMDTPNAEVYHIRLENSESKVKRVTSDVEKSEICEDLGYRPSDLLQTNCIIWVEGPSDRIYINSWIKFKAPHLVSGIHYSIMFYGGRLASHISGNDTEVDEFISLRRLNRRAVIVIDSDKENSGIKINATKARLVHEFNHGPGYSWVTKGREIENYLPPEQIKAAIKSVKPSAKCNSNLGKYDNTLSIITKSNKESQVSKVEVAKYIVKSNDVDLSTLDLESQIDKLIMFIEESNPRLTMSVT